MTVVNTATYIVYLTSPAARNPLEKGDDMGNATELKMLWISTKMKTNRFVSFDKSYKFKTYGVVKRIMPFHKMDETKVIFNNLII